MRRATNTAIRGSDPNRVLSRENEDLVVGIAPHKAVYTCEKCGNDVVVPLHPEAAAPPTWNCPCGGIAEYVGDREIGEELKSFAPASASKPPKTHIDHVRERRTDEELQALLDKRLDLLRSGKMFADDRRL